MRYIRFVFAILLVSLLLVNANVEVLAMETGFSTEEMSQESVDDFLESINLTFLITDDQLKGRIDSFDVSENGMVAVAHHLIYTDNIFIYNSEGEFQYGYSVNSYGVVEVEFDNDNLIICFVRSDVALSVDSNGEVQSVLEIPNTKENEEHWKYLTYLREKTVGDTKYSLEGFSDYNKVIARNASGEETVIYDATAEILIYDLVIAGIFLIGVICAHKKIKRSK